MNSASLFIRFDDPVLSEALNRLAAARTRFDFADSPEAIDAAIYDLTAAELGLRAVIKRARVDSLQGGVCPACYSTMCNCA